MTNCGSTPCSDKEFSSSLCVQTSSEAHPASDPVCTGVPFPGGKTQPGRDAGHSSHLVLKSGISRDSISSQPWLLHGVAGQHFFT
jgi:hypothetical protein